jgi:beta-lactam-binding protein with PASTA domain
MTRKLFSASCLACAVLLAACGGGGSSGGGLSSAPVAVPNVVGQTQAAATTAITSAGLTPGAITTQASANIATGNVISESPSAGASVAKGSVVALVVSTGPAVPNVVGDSQSAATSAIQAAGLTVGTVGKQSSATVAANDVISETPSANTSVKSGSAVDLIVSTGPAMPVTVPTFVGQTQAAATTAITNAGFVLGNVTRQASTTIAAGAVISQNPAAGASVNSGSGVVLVVSSGATAANTVPVIVDAGPPAAQGTANTLFATVTICAPGTGSCQTIDHVQIDTGSVGVSIVASVVDGPIFPALNDPGTGSPLIECVQYADGYTWGSMVTADVTIGGRTVAGVPVHLMGDGAAGAAPNGNNGCVSGTEEDTVAQFGANGILGVGYWLQDCGSFCVQNAATGGYYVCPNQNCQPTTVPLSNQQQNPVALFTSDNNGIMIQLPAVAAPGEATVTGTLYFGVGTQPNNAVGSATFYGVDGNGRLITQFGGQALSGSFIDSGSNAYFFASSSLTACSAQTATGFFCPTNSTAESAMISGSNGTPTSPTIDFTVDNADNLFSNSSLSAFPNLAGPNSSLTGVTNSFDWGLPFFFNRNVFVLFEQNSVNGTSGPASAF